MRPTLIRTFAVRNLRPGGPVPLGSPTPGPKVPSAQQCLLRRCRPPPVQGHPDFRGTVPYSQLTHRFLRCCCCCCHCSRLRAETLGFPGAGGATDSNITSARRHSQSAAGPAGCGPESGALGARSTASATGPCGPLVLVFSATGAPGSGPSSFMVSSERTTSVATSKHPLWLFSLGLPWP